jgi:hypothetical protein
MRKALPLVILFVFLTAWARSQQLNPSILASDGGISNAAGISLEWTLGETMIESLSTADRLYTQGFHQPVLFAKGVTAPIEPVVSRYIISVAPNPVESLLKATITSAGNEKFSLSLIDFTGRRYSVPSAYGKSSTVYVDMSAMTSGIYLLEIRNELNKVIQVFKVFKGL